MNAFRSIAKGAVVAAFVPPLAVAALFARAWRAVSPRGGKRPRLVWAGAAIYSIAASSRAMRQHGFDTLSIANGRYRTVLDSDFDLWLPDQAGAGPAGRVRHLFHAAAMFVRSMFTRDVLHAYFNGGMLGKTPLSDWEFRLWKLAGGKVVLFPYGSDAFVYSRLPHSEWAEALKEDYPRTAEDDRVVGLRVDRFTDLADAIVGCLVHTVCLRRVDFWTVLWYPADLSVEPAAPSLSGPIRIAHAPNHRRIKGSSFLIEAVDGLRARGHDIELDLIEGVGREEVIERFRKADIVVDQLLFGYALTALEGLSLGKIVLSGISNDPMYEPFRRLSYLDETPVVPTSSATIGADLEALIARRAEWPELGKRSRAYVERRHSPAATAELMKGVYRKLGFTGE